MVKQYKALTDSDFLKNWAVKMDSNGKLEKYIQDHTIPQSMKKL